MSERDWMLYDAEMRAANRRANWMLLLGVIMLVGTLAALVAIVGRP